MKNPSTTENILLGTKNRASSMPHASSMTIMPASYRLYIFSASPTKIMPSKNKKKIVKAYNISLFLTREYTTSPPRLPAVPGITGECPR
jgi:hypothetical protein